MQGYREVPEELSSTTVRRELPTSAECATAIPTHERHTEMKLAKNRDISLRNVRQVVRDVICFT